MNSVNTAQPHTVPVKTLTDERGHLGIVEAMADAGFLFRRLYFLYGTTGEARGHHAHKALRQYMLAIHGAFTVTLKGRGQTFTFRLESPTQALIIPPGYWRELEDFTVDAVCLVAASAEYDEADYIRDYNEFLQWEQTHA